VRWKQCGRGVVRSALGVRIEARKGWVHERVRPPQKFFLVLVLKMVILVHSES